MMIPLQIQILLLERSMGNQIQGDQTKRVCQSTRWEPLHITETRILRTCSLPFRLVTHKKERGGQPRKRINESQIIFITIFLFNSYQYQYAEPRGSA
jgi:hypothetical protein